MTKILKVELSTRTYNENKMQIQSLANRAKVTSTILAAERAVAGLTHQAGRQNLETGSGQTSGGCGSGQDGRRGGEIRETRHAGGIGIRGHVTRTGVR